MDTDLNAIKKVNTRNNLIFIADVVLFFILLNTLPFTPEANKSLALLVFIAILWLTEALHVTVTALLVPILGILLGLVKSKEALAAFADPTIFLFFGGFALATALHIQNLDRLIANKIMAMSRGKLSVAAIYLFSVTAFLSMWMSNTATAAMMLPLAMGILSKLDPKRDHNTYVFVLLGIAYSASIGGMGTLVGSPPNGIVATQLGVSFAEWMKYGLPIMLILMPLMIGVLYVVFRPKFDLQFEQSFEKIELTPTRILTLIIFALTAIGWIFSSKINPALSSLLGLQGKIASFDTIIALIATAVICITRGNKFKKVQNGACYSSLEAA